MSKQFDLDSVLNQPQMLVVKGRKITGRVLLIGEEQRWAELAEDDLPGQLALLADLLNRRKADKGEAITPEWISDNLSLPEATALMTILRTGSVPGGDEGKG